MHPCDLRYRTCTNTTMSAILIGPYRFTGTDARKTFSGLGEWAHHLLDGLAEDVQTHAAHTWLAALAPHAPTTSTSDGRPLSNLEHVGRALAERCAADPASAEVRDALAALWHGVLHITGSLRERGVLATEGRATVAQISTSAGGVPKRAVPHASIGFSGLRGDRQGARTHHGRPWQALCLWSGEVIDALAADGHPIAPGCAGENLTLRGIDWSLIRPGVRLRIGTALAEASAWAIPCRKNAIWFSDGGYQRLGHQRGPVSRIYATVIEEGEVAAGDAAELVP